MESKSAQSDDGAARKRAMEKLLGRLSQLLAAGKTFDEAAIIAAHPELMPELQVELRKLRTETVAATMLPPAEPSTTYAAPAPATTAISATGYVFQRELGRGGQAVVYLAVQQSTGRKVAVKVMRKEALADERALARFKREVQVLAALDHPNIVGIVDTGVASDGSQFIVMSYVAGSPLDEYLKVAQDSANPSKLLRLFLKICAAVNVAHVRGIVHRDLKPGNIRIDERGEPHILDFGLAHMGLDHLPGEDHPMSVTGEFMGSLPWCSPEQAAKDPERIDIRSDVYSLGVILYQILTGGRFPYVVVGNIRDVLNNILTAAPTPPSKAAVPKTRDAGGTGPINPTIERIVMKALAKNREERYQSAGELGRDIAGYLSGQRAPVAAAAPEPAPKRSSAKMLAGIGIGSLVCAAAAVGLVLLRKPQGAAPPAATPAVIAPVAASAPAVMVPTSQVSETAAEQPMPPNVSIAFGTCHMDGDAVALTPGVKGGCSMGFGNVNWTDYDLSFLARTNGSRGFWASTRASRGNYCQFLLDAFSDNLGAISRHEGLTHRMAPPEHFRLEPDRWYAVKVEVRGSVMRLFVDGENLMTVRDDQLKTGRVVIGTRNPQVRFREIQVTAPDGTVLWNGPPDLSRLPPEELDSGNAAATAEYRKTDLLARVDPNKNALQGLWTMQEGVLGGQGPGAQMQLGTAPAGEYDFRVTFTRADGEEPIGLAGSYEGHPFGWIVGGHNNTMAGFAMVGGLDYDANKTTRNSTQWITNGQTHVAVLQVRGDALAVYLDGRAAGEMDTDYSNVTLPASWRAGGGAMLGVWLGGDRVLIQSADVIQEGTAGAATTEP
ncbi:MAG: protein kinase [Tepidisphaeraceae bacterium]|jgi:tRNA A-37 threonylcarbamoyl transferase component Bud32